MASADNLPFEVGYERVKQNLVRVINQIGEQEEMPASLMIIILENIVREFKLNNYSTIIGNYDILFPEGAELRNNKSGQKPKHVTVDMIPEELKQNINQEPNKKQEIKSEVVKKS